MLSPEKFAQLQSFLGRLPVAIAARLARAVERDRLAGGVLLPHQAILDALRPVLAREPRVERIPVSQRLFCRPFEDLLVETVPRQKQKGRIARASVAPVWNWLRTTLLPDAAAKFNDATRVLALADRADDARRQALAFWPPAAAAIQNAIATDRKAARTALGSDLVLADAQEMVLLLAAGHEIAEVQDLLVLPTPHLGEELLRALREIEERLAQRLPDSAPYVAVVAMRRLAHPWEALKLPQLIAHQTQDTLISNTDMGLVGDLLFADIETHASAISAVRHPAFDADALIERLRRFAGLSGGLVNEIDIRRDGKWGKCLLADRATVATTLEGLMERAPKEVLAMLPVQARGSFGGGPRVADFARAVSDEKAERGLRYGRLVAGSAPLAANAAFGAAQKRAMEEISRHLIGYNEDLVREMRSAGGPHRAVVERQFELAAELTALIFSPEEAEFLRRRGRAALANAA